MSIYRYCGHCGSSFNRDLDRCKRCGVKFSKANGRFLVSASGQTRVCDSYSDAKITEAALTLQIPFGFAEQVRQVKERLAELKSQASPGRQDTLDLVAEVTALVETLVPGIGKMAQELLDEERDDKK